MISSVYTSVEPAVAIEVEARAENVMLVRQTVEGVARALNADEAVVDDIKLAVTEACSNVVKYAYPGSSGNMRVKLLPEDDHMIVFVRDFGTWQPHNATGGIEASGMGIPLMNAVTVRHEITKGDDGTEVLLEFALHGQAPTQAISTDDE